MSIGDPFDRLVGALEARGLVRRRSADSHGRDNVRALCPVHDDKQPSLSVTRTELGVVLNCFAPQCYKKPRPIVEALGLRWADLFSGPRPPRPSAAIAATYNYTDPDGVIIARKLRYEPKAFAVQHPDPTAKSGWRWGLDGRVIGLYRLPELMGAPMVFLAEGEKAVDRLVGLGLVATCGYLGAGRWKPEWSSALMSAGCREAVILADNDQAGAQHAEKVAGDLRALDETIIVRVIRFPDLAPGGDAVDFLDAGHTVADLLEVVASTPAWSPEAEEQRRAEIRKAHHRDRMRKYRAALSGDDQIRPVARSDETVLVAVLEALEAPGSGRDVKKALARRQPQRAIERALDLGVRTNVLVAEGGRPGGRPWRYRRASDIPSVTDARHFSDLHNITGPRHSAPSVASVARDGGADPPSSAAFPEQIQSVAAPVTPCAVIPPECSFFALQGPRDLPSDIHPVTEGCDTLGITAEADLAVGWRVEKMRAQITGAAALPFLVARPGPVPIGCCVSCGDALEQAPALGVGRCRPCRVAASMVAAAFLRDTLVPAAARQATVA